MPARSSRARPPRELFARPANPYTKGLLLSVPNPDARGRGRRSIRFPACRRTSRTCRPAARSRRGAIAPRTICRDASFRRSSQLTPGHHSLCHFADATSTRGSGAAHDDRIDAPSPLVSIAGSRQVHFDLGARRRSGDRLDRGGAARRESSRASTASRSISCRARRSAWSANRAAARRRSAARCCGWWSRPAGRVLFRGVDITRAVARRAAPRAAAHADDLPGPVRVARSADDRRADHRRADRHVRLARGSEQRRARFAS